MRFKLNIPRNSVNKDMQYINDVFNEGRYFPVLTIGRDSYIEEVIVENVLDEQCIYNVQVGRYSSIASDITFVVDMNHDFKRCAQGGIGGIKYKRPHLIKRKGQIIIMNDCWIGEKVIIMSGVTVGNGAVIAAGSVVAKNVPDYAIVAGNPARVIGWRFEKEQIAALDTIRWWNWSEKKVVENAKLLYESPEEFIEKHYECAACELREIVPVDIKTISKENVGEEKILLYIPDFEQQYPTYPKVIDAFVKEYADTNYELLLYIQEDDILDDKLALLDKLFGQYKNERCYVNLYIGNIDDMRTIFCQADAYITNRSVDNICYMDMACLYGLSVISGVDVPIFSDLGGMIREPSRDKSEETVKKLNYIINKQNQMIRKLQDELYTDISEVYDVLKGMLNRQVALDAAFGNLEYEFFARDKKYEYPIVESGDKAIDLIISEGKSMCRFGDGEFAIMTGVFRQKFQCVDKELTRRLKEILVTEREDILIGITDVYGDLSKYNDDGRCNIRAYLTPEVRKQHYALIDMNKVYYDSYMTRPYVIYRDNMTDAPVRRFAHLKQIWEGKRLLIVEGEKTHMGVGNDLLDNADDIIRILGPAEHAFSRYDDILQSVLKFGKDRLILIAMGPAATVLAYDLACAGYQALDIGHVDMEYEWMLAGKGGRTAVPYKYNNELKGGDIVEEIKDEKYEMQIVDRFL